MNYEAYNDELAKSIKDKLWFVNKIHDLTKPRIIIDYGCGNTQLLQQLPGMFGAILVGYDHDENMINDKAIGIKIFTNFDKLMWHIHALQCSVKYEVVLILSSVLHEVYSSGKQSEFTDHLTELDPDLIVVRDMMVSKASICSSGSSVRHIITRTTKAELDSFKEFESFESRWGSIDSNINLLHYLLKYRFTENWERENNENYLSVFLEDHINFLSNKYDLAYLKHYVLPFVQMQVRSDFGITITDPTHVNILWRKQ